MKAILLAAILVVGVAIVVTPAASACSDPEYPCDPPPMPICPSSLKADPVRWVWCNLVP